MIGRVRAVAQQHTDATVKFVKSVELFVLRPIKDSKPRQSSGAKYFLVSASAQNSRGQYCLSVNPSGEGLKLDSSNVTVDTICRLPGCGDRTSDAGSADDRCGSARPRATSPSAAIQGLPRPIAGRSVACPITLTSRQALRRACLSLNVVELLAKAYGGSVCAEDHAGYDEC